jgi:hypothetical protein
MSIYLIYQEPYKNNKNYGYKRTDKQSKNETRTRIKE